MKTKSQMAVKWAKKHGIKVKELKLKKVKAKDFVGYPVPKTWAGWAKAQTIEDKKRLLEFINCRPFDLYLHLFNPLWVWEV